jgi:prolyl-tRNA synthetase
MGAKSLCIPFDQPQGEDKIVPGVTKCVRCGENAKVSTHKLLRKKSISNVIVQHYTLFGRSY